jgi:hypothetical protein
MLKLGLGDRSRYRIQHIPGLTGDIAKRVVEGTVHAEFGELPVDQTELISHVIVLPHKQAVLACERSWSQRLPGHRRSRDVGRRQQAQADLLLYHHNRFWWAKCVSHDLELIPNPGKKSSIS